MTKIIVPAVFETRAMRQALALPIPGGEWPEDQKLRAAEQPAGIGQVLVQHTHKHLVNVSIGYLFVEQMASGDRDVLAKSSKLSGPAEYYSKHAFLVKVNWATWCTLDPHQRVALIDHQLSYFGVEDTEAGKKYVLVEPDFTEEFFPIVQRWGLWRADLRKLSSVMLQRDLFETEAPPAGSVETDGTPG
jgi:hypothetical protein